MLDLRPRINLSSKVYANQLYPTRSVELKKDTVIVVLGASGDLAKKKTVSALICLLITC